MIPLGTDLSQYAFGPAQNFFAQQPGVPMASDLRPISTPGLPAIQPSPLAGAQEQQALQALSGLAFGIPSGTGPQASDIGASARSAPSTGSVVGDARAAHEAGLTGIGLGMVANPASLPATVAGTLAASAIRGIAGVPNPTNARNAIGIRGLFGAIRDATMGVPKNEMLDRLEAVQATQRREAIEAAFGSQEGEKPSALSATEAQAQADNAAATGDMGGAKSDTGSEGGKGSPGDGGAKAAGGLVKPTDGRVIPLAGGGKIAMGPGGGLDDLIPTTIDGQRAAALSDGEFVIPADVVSMMGDGSTRAGSQRLYDLVRSIREAKTGTSEQAGPLPVGQILKRIAAR